MSNQKLIDGIKEVISEEKYSELCFVTIQKGMAVNVAEVEERLTEIVKEMVLDLLNVT